MSSSAVHTPRLSDRAFGLAFTIFFIFIAAIGWLVFDHIIIWAIAFAVGLAFLTLLTPGILLPFNRLWGVFAHKLGALNNTVLLGLFFFILMLPIGCIIRLIGKDPMTRKKRKGTISYWTPIARHAEPDTFSDMF
jgi:hypothetical protein